MQLQQHAAMLIEAMPPVLALQELIILQNALADMPLAMQTRALAQWVEQHLRYEVESGNPKPACPVCAGVGIVSELEMLNAVRDVYVDVPCPACQGGS